MFKWDGSEIKDLFSNETIIEEGKLDKNTYWRIIRGNKEEYCLLRNATNNSTLSCLIDELKPIFKIEKNGTHWIRYKGKKYILLKVNTKNRVVILDLSLDKFGYHEYLEPEVQKIFIFRELLGLSCNYEKNIVLRKVGKFIKPISFYETNMIPAKEEKVIPNKIIEKWFSNNTLDEIVKRMFRIKTNQDIINLTHELRNKMEKIVERVDKNHITTVSEIIQRIVNRLQYILD
jgi:hypothetical protein